MLIIPGCAFADLLLWQMEFDVSECHRNDMQCAPLCMLNNSPRNNYRGHLFHAPQFRNLFDELIGNKLGQVDFDFSSRNFSQASAVAQKSVEKNRTSNEKKKRKLQNTTASHMFTRLASP